MAAAAEGGEAPRWPCRAATAPQLEVAAAAAGPRRRAGAPVVPTAAAVGEALCSPHSRTGVPSEAYTCTQIASVAARPLA